MNSNAVISSITLSPAPHLTWYYCLSDGIFFRIFPTVVCESKQEIRASLFCCKHRNRVLPVSCGRAAEPNQTKMWCITRTLLFPQWENRCGVGSLDSCGSGAEADQTKRQVVREKNRNWLEFHCALPHLISNSSSSLFCSSSFSFYSASSPSDVICEAHHEIVAW